VSKTYINFLAPGVDQCGIKGEKVMNINEDLYNTLQASYHCSKEARSPKNCIPELRKFTEALLNDHQSEAILHKIAEEGKNLLQALPALKEKSVAEINQIRMLLAQYRASIPAIDDILKKCDKIEAIRIPQSHELIANLNDQLRKACQVIVWENRDGSYTNILAQLVKLDAKNHVADK
jgi:hypothetical protein